MREEFQDEDADLDRPCEELPFRGSETTATYFRSFPAAAIASLATERVAGISLRLSAGKKGVLWACPE